MKNKKIPNRKCIACNKEFPKKDLIRIVKSKENEISVDKTGKLNGRGAYVCKDQECLENLKTNERLAHALKSKISESIYEEIEAYVNES